MEDDNGLDLTLSLPCGGPSTASKGKSSSSSDTRIEQVDRGSKLIDDFKNFLDGGTLKQDPQRNDAIRPEENLFYDLSKVSASNDAPLDLSNGGFWSGNDKSFDTRDERRPESSSKRKNMFDELNSHKKLEREAHVHDLQEKTRTSHISITTDEASTAENEDVADSEADGTSSRMVQHHDDVLKLHNSGVGFFEGSKEVHGVSGSSVVDLQSQKRFTITSEKDIKIGNMSYGTPFPGQSLNVLNMPNSNSVSRPPTNFAVTGMIPTMASANSDRLENQPVIPANVPLMFGYSPVQISTTNSASMPGIGHSPSGSMRYDGKTLDFNKGDDKHPKEEGSSSHAENNGYGANGTRLAKYTPEQARAIGFTSEYPAIRAGIAAELKFGGSGTPPNLPWVSTTGPGPNGRTISGVTYKYSGTEIRIVCACHGSHMSREQFIQHAAEDQTNPNPGSALASFPSSNPATSAQS